MNVNEKDNANATPNDKDAGSNKCASLIVAHVCAAIVYFIVVVGFVYAAGGKLSGAGTSELKGLGYLQAIPEYGPYFFTSCIPLWVGVATSLRGTDKSKLAWLWILLSLAASGVVLWLVPVAG